MLATLGFSVTGLCFGIFAYTFNSLVIHKAKLKLKQFAYGYYSLAIAFLIWGVATAVGGNTLLKNSVIVGDGFLLLSTVFILAAGLGRKRKGWLVPAIIIAGALLYVRIHYYSPVPYMRGGILIFNTQRSVAIALGLIIALIWLPVNIHVARLVTRKIGQHEITSMYEAIYSAATLAALIFLAARRTATVVLSFTAIGICFIMLIKSNMLVAKFAKGSHHGK